MAKRKLRKISNGVKVGLIAILINLITVFVYIYQTSIMQEQQKASVWPYIEWESTYNQNDGFKIRVSNNGVGPALITKMKIKLNNEVQPNLDSLVSRLVGTTSIPHYKNVFQKKVLPANSSLYLIKSNDHTWSELLFMACQNNKLEIQICYESVYKDQWVSTGAEVIESSCDF